MSAHAIGAAELGLVALKRVAPTFIPAGTDICDRQKYRGMVLDAEETALGSGFTGGQIGFTPNWISQELTAERQDKNYLESQSLARMHRESVISEFAL